MITFHCPNCGMKLQVPAQMAGVTGPCPQCSANISAPAANQELPGNTPIATSAPSSQPTAQPQVQQPVQQVAQHQGSAQKQPDPLAQKLPQTEQQSAAPRQAIPPARQSSRPARKHDSLPRDIEAPKTPRNWMRVIFPMAFLAVATITVLIVLQAAGIYEIYDLSKLTSGNSNTSTLQEDTDTTKEPANTPKDPGPDSPAPSVGSPVTAADPEDSTSPIPVSKDPPVESIDGEFPELELPPPVTKVKPTDDTPEPITPDPIKPTDDPIKPPNEPVKSSDDPIEPDKEPDKIPSIAPDKNPIPTRTDEQSPPIAGSPAYQILTRFLEAKSLDERLPLMSKSKLTDEELKKSCLAGPLAAVKAKRLVTMVPRDSDGMIQYLYSVSFQDETSTRLRHRIIVQLVERPKVHPPRVHATAFIEHYEKKFLAYGANPTDKVTTFHCIAEVRTSIMAKNIPEKVKNNSVRLVIKTHPDSESMFDAFLNKNSPLMDQIGPGKEFPYVEPKFCILSFRWNTSHPDKPYIELNDIVTTGWEK